MTNGWHGLSAACPCAAEADRRRRGLRRLQLAPHVHPRAGHLHQPRPAATGSWGALRLRRGESDVVRGSGGTLLLGCEYFTWKVDWCHRGNSNRSGNMGYFSLLRWICWNTRLVYNAVSKRSCTSRGRSGKFLARHMNCRAQCARPTGLIGAASGALAAATAGATTALSGTVAATSTVAATALTDYITVHGTDPSQDQQNVCEY